MTILTPTELSDAFVKRAESTAHDCRDSEEFQQESCSPQQTLWNDFCCNKHHLWYEVLNFFSGAFNSRGIKIQCKQNHSKKDSDELAKLNVATFLG